MMVQIKNQIKNMIKKMIINENEDKYNSDILNSLNVSEYGDDDTKYLNIPNGGKKEWLKIMILYY